MHKSIDLTKTVYELCSQDPELIDILAEVGFRDIRLPGMLQTAGRFMTIPKGAAAKRIDMQTIQTALINRGYRITL